MMTSIAESCIRTYFAAVAPPQPPPMTTTRRPVRFGERSDGVLVAVIESPLLAQPARPETATATPEARRNSRRVIRAMTSPPDCHGRWVAPVRYSGSVRRGELSRVLVPRSDERPGGGDADHEQQRGAPAHGGGQEDGDAELGERAAESDARDRRAEREARDGRPELDLALAGPPDGARAAPASERHADAEQRAAEQPSDARGGEDPVALVLEIGELEDRKAHCADHERQRGSTRVLGVAGHERLSERAHETEARAVKDHAEDGAEEQKDAALRVAGRRIRERRDDQCGKEQQADERLPARLAMGARPRAAAAARPAGTMRGLPEEITQPEECADAEPHHHREAGEAERAHGRKEAADVAAERQRRAHA